MQDETEPEMSLFRQIIIGGRTHTRISLLLFAYHLCCCFHLNVQTKMQIYVFDQKKKDANICRIKPLLLKRSIAYMRTITFINL